MIEEFTKNAADAYSRILTRYPLMDRTVDAKARLEALHQPIPQADQGSARAEQGRRRQPPGSQHSFQSDGEFQKHPDVAQATESASPRWWIPKW